MTSAAPRRYEWMPMSMHSRQATLSLLQRKKSAMTRLNPVISTPKQTQTRQAPPTHHVSFKLQSQVEMSQLSLDSSLQPSLVSMPRSSLRRDGSPERRSSLEAHQLVHKHSNCRASSLASDARRTVPLIPHDQHSTFTSASQTIMGSPKSVTRKQPARSGRGALQRAKQQAMQAPFKSKALFKNTENRSVLPSQGSVGGTSSSSDSLFRNNHSLGQHSISNSAGKGSTASLGTRSVVTMEPEQLAATKASLKIEFQRFVQEKETFLKKKEHEMLQIIIGHAKDLAKSLTATIEQGKSDIMAEANKKHSETDQKSEYMALHQSKMKEAQNQINLDMNRAKKEAIEEIRLEHSSILDTLEMEKKNLVTTGKEIIAQAIQAKDTALASINKFHSGAIRSLTGYLKSIAMGKKVVQPTRDDFSLTFVTTPRKKRSPYSKPMSSEKTQSRDFETCGNSFESDLEDRMSQDPMKKRRHVNASKSKDTRKNKPNSEPPTAPDAKATSNLRVNTHESERRSSHFKLISPSSTAMTKIVPVVSSRKQKRFPRHFQGRSKRARIHTSSTHPLDFKDDVTFSFRGM